MRERKCVYVRHTPALLLLLYPPDVCVCDRESVRERVCIFICVVPRHCCCYRTPLMCVCVCVCVSVCVREREYAYVCHTPALLLLLSCPHDVCV